MIFVPLPVHRGHHRCYSGMVGSWGSQRVEDRTLAYRLDDETVNREEILKSSTLPARPQSLHTQYDSFVTAMAIAAQAFSGDVTVSDHTTPLSIYENVKVKFDFALVLFWDRVLCKGTPASCGA